MIVCYYLAKRGKACHHIEEYLVSENQQPQGKTIPFIADKSPVYQSYQKPEVMRTNQSAFSCLLSLQLETHWMYNSSSDRLKVAGIVLMSYPTLRRAVSKALSSISTLKGHTKFLKIKDSVASLGAAVYPSPGRVLARVRAQLGSGYTKEVK